MLITAVRAIPASSIKLASVLYVFTVCSCKVVTTRKRVIRVRAIRIRWTFRRRALVLDKLISFLTTVFMFFTRIVLEFMLAALKF